MLDWTVPGQRGDPERGAAGDHGRCDRLLLPGGGHRDNNNAVGVHITIKFKAHDGRFADPMSTVVYFIKDFQPKSVHTISAAGLLFPCSSVASVKYEVYVKGLDSPPE